MRQPQLFETEDQYGNDIIQGPKLTKKNLTTKEALIDPKNPGTVGTSLWNLGNHTLAICFLFINSAKTLPNYFNQSFCQYL